METECIEAQMETNQSSHSTKKVLTIGGLLVTMGVVYGDIGTSPLYVMKAIIEGNGGLASLSKDFVYGAVSLVFWTLTLLTTVKYVMIALNADNQGEGGIFALYTLVRKKARFLIIPAMIGGATLLADGVLTPAVTVTTAIEGLRGIPVVYDAIGDNQSIIVWITIGIIFCLFQIQRFGTETVGRAFGPIMFCWFTFLGLTGLYNFAQDLSLIAAINPYYAIRLLFSPENKVGIFILGSVFLATTGAEALYSDLGHVGKRNIRVSWPYVKICLVLNYFGQAAWLLKVKNDMTYIQADDLNPFFRMMPAGLEFFSVIFATVAAIIASQSLITGSYTLVAEAIRLRLLPKLKIVYPSTQKGQLYIPTVNNLLFLLCIGVVFYFRTSAHMEAAYGLAITVTMLMTTFLLYYYLLQKEVPPLIAGVSMAFFAGIEIIFFVSSIVKFLHGGYVAALIALMILAVMLIWERGNLIEERYADKVSLYDYKNQLKSLSQDQTIPMYQTNLVFLTGNLKNHRIGREILYSILDKRPKRAKVYWFVNVAVTDDPYTEEYYVDTMGTDCIVNIQLRLGFRVSQSVNVYLRQIVQDLMREGTIKPQPQTYTITPGRIVGDFCFILIKEELSRLTHLKKFDRMIMQAKLAIKKIAVSPDRWFGLEFSDYRVEYVPLIIGQQLKSNLSRVNVKDF